MPEYEAKLIRVLDGDTQSYKVSMTVRFLDQLHTHVHPDQHVRLLGAWCPEKNQPGGSAATAFAHDWLVLHDHATGEGLVIESANTYTLGRLLGIVRCAKDRACLNEELVASGHATASKEKAHLEALRLLMRETGAASPAGRLLLKATA
jgi:endonuclease YncB( thermonuclease family)